MVWHRSTTYDVAEVCFALYKMMLKYDIKLNEGADLYDLIMRPIITKKYRKKTWCIRGNIIRG